MPHSSTQSIEKIIDILFEEPDPQAGLQNCLQFLIKEAGCQGGLIFIRRGRESQDFVWLAEGVPPEWQIQTVATDSLLQSLAMVICRTGEVIQANPAQDLIGGMPLVFANVTYGGVLFYDKTPIELPYEYLGRLTRLMAHWVRRNSFFFANPALNNFAFLDLVVATQDIFQGLQGIQQRVIEGIQRLINPDGVILYFYFPEKNNLIEKIEHNYLSGRLQHSVAYLTESLLKKCIFGKKILLITNPRNSENFNLEIDGLADIEANSMVMIPMVVNDEVVGAVELLFSQQPTLTSYQQNMLATIVTTLGFSTINSRHIQQLRIANADIEANRWELIRSRNILRALFDSLPSSIYILDRTYRIVAVNMTRARRAGVSPSNLVGNKCYEALYNHKEVCPGCLVNETLFSGSNTSRFSRLWANEQLLEWEINTFVVLNDENQPGQAIVIEQDVTEKRRLEANLVQSEKLAAVGQLAAGVAHEINNPLAAIIANAQILARDLRGDQDKLESVELIELAGVRASEVVKNLLGIARKEQYDFELTDLNDTVENAIKLVQHELVAQSVTLIKDIGDNLPMLLASRDHLQGVWVNMMMNALDAMEGQVGRLAITTRFANNEYRVSIADNGHGIPPERLSQIFEPFYSTKTANHGTGLGLSICQRVIKNHGGYITVDSQVGVGTRFTIILPGNSKQI